MTTHSIFASGGPQTATMEEPYEHEETRELVGLVEDAAELVRTQGEAVFSAFRAPASRWRSAETYIFVLDPDGNMLLHPEPELEGSNVLDLKDMNGRPIIRGLIDAATALPERPEGWYHYQWPVPGGLLPRWKSSFVKLVAGPSGKKYIVGSGMYNDRMERAFVQDAVTRAVAEIEKHGKAAFQLFRDPTGPFLFKDAYIFVTSMAAVELVNPVFPSLEGQDLLDVQDSTGKYLNREIGDVVRTRGTGWVDYMWPKPGESVSTQKSAYVSGAKIGDEQVVVGCGVYLADAPKEVRTEPKITATQVMTLVREAAAILQAQGEEAYPTFRQKKSKWLHDDIYLFVFRIDGVNAFHAAEPEAEGRNDRGLRDALGRPIVGMILDAAATPSGEGWVHYMYPEPGGLFPAWKSSFVKRVTFPSGKPHIVGCGIYNMRMDKPFIEDVVNRAAGLIEQHGTNAFAELRDNTGPFVFMDTYVFVESPDGTELVNPAQPALEGKNLLQMKDLRGKEPVREEIAAAMKEGSAWLECYWYKPGDNTPARKLTYVRKVQAGPETFIVGSGIYPG